MRTDLLRRSTACLALFAGCALVPAVAQAAPAPLPSPGVTAINTSPSPGWTPGGTPGTTPVPTSGTPRPAGACQVTYRTISAWPGGFVGELTVSTSNPITAWSVAAYAGGSSVQQVWGGELASPSPGILVVRNASWNGTLPAGGTATVGMYGTGTPPTSLFTCTA